LEGLSGVPTLTSNTAVLSEFISILKLKGKDRYLIFLKGDKKRKVRKGIPDFSRF
jgi:hypothetical protein